MATRKAKIVGLNELTKGEVAPNASFVEMKAAYNRQDWQTMFDRADALWEHMQRGGEAPEALAFEANPMLVIYSYRRIARYGLREATID